MGSKPNFSKTSQTSNLLKPFYTVKETAALLGKSENTITNWCKAGRLRAIPESFGTRITFRIPAASIEHHVSEKKHSDELLAASHLHKVKRETLSSEQVQERLATFERYCLQGLINGKPFSRATVNTYRFYLEKFTSQNPEPSPAALEAELLEIPAVNFSKRLKLYEAVVCFTKFLIKLGEASPDLLETYKALRPKRHQPPKRHAVNEEDVTLLEQACLTLSQRLMLDLLFSTGLRASEFCNLKVQDINLRDGELTVRLGKGGKTRTVGLSPDIIQMIRTFLAENPRRSSDFLFLNDLGQQMTRYGLRDRLKRIGRKVGIHVHPHALRRAFVTVNANKGRSLVMLQIACGHSDIATTRSYCRTSEREVIEAMKAW